MTMFRPLRRTVPPAHRDVFAEFALRLVGLIVERKMARDREPQPRLQVAQ